MFSHRPTRPARPGAATSPAESRPESARLPAPDSAIDETRPRRRWARLLEYRLRTRTHSVLAFAAILTATLLAGADIAHAAGADGPAVLAAENLQEVINNLRVWLIGILAALATLFLTIGAVRYLAAGGDPSEVEKAKVALKSAAIGYCLALLAPVLVTLLGQLVG